MQLDVVLVVKYALFAVVSILANIATQEAFLRTMVAQRVFIDSTVFPPLAVSIGAGTVVGFCIKYILDKRWIFREPYTEHARELQKIMLYGAFSVVTTLIFWAFEVAFWAVWQTNVSKYTGAIFGLLVGYVSKYFLDKHFVFTKRARR